MIPTESSAALLAVVGAGLTPMQLDVFLDQLLLGKSLDVLAGEYGVSRSAIGQASKRARRKLAKQMAVAA